MEVANTSWAERTNIDSIGSIILCKFRVEFNQMAVTGIPHALTNSWCLASSACSAGACRFINSRAKTPCPNWKLLVAFVIGKAFFDDIWWKKKEKKRKKINCYPLISLFIHCNAWVQKWREQLPAETKQIPFQPRAALLLIRLEEQGPCLQQLSTPMVCKPCSSKYTKVWVFLHHLFGLQNRVKISWEQELSWEYLNFRSGQKVSWISIPDNISVILCWSQLEPVHAEAAAKQKIS